MRFEQFKAGVRSFAFCTAFVVGLFVAGPKTFGQATANVAAPPGSVLPVVAQRALADAGQSATMELQDLERRWRAVFRDARSRPRLEGFVEESLDFFERLRQIRDRVVNPDATKDRIRELFRARILDEDTLCRVMERSLREFCEKLDEQDQALLIKLKIDRAATRTTLSRSVIDPASFKRPIYAAASAAVEAVENDLSRCIASNVAGQALGTAVNQAARDLGFGLGEEGSFLDFLGGMVIDIGVGMAVDAATDPTDGMVRNLDGQLAKAEQAILEGTPAAPGFLATLRRVAQERGEARVKIVRIELAK